MTHGRRARARSRSHHRESADSAAALAETPLCTAVYLCTTVSTPFTDYAVWKVSTSSVDRCRPACTPVFGLAGLQTPLCTLISSRVKANKVKREI